MKNPILNRIKEISVLTCRVDKEDFEKLKNNRYFSKFIFSNGKSIKKFNPFIEDEEIQDLIKLSFFENDGKYRIIYNSSDSLIYKSEYENFLENIFQKFYVDTIENSQWLDEFKAFDYYDNTVKMDINGRYYVNSPQEKENIIKFCDSYEIIENFKEKIANGWTYFGGVDEYYEELGKANERYNKFMDEFYNSKPVYNNIIKIAEDIQNGKMNKYLQDGEIMENQVEQKLKTINESLNDLSETNQKTLKYYLKDMNNTKERKFGIEEIYQIFLGMKENINFQVYAKPCYNALQMNQLRQAIIECVALSNMIDDENIKNAIKSIYKIIETPKLSPELMQLGRITSYVKYKNGLDYKLGKETIFSKDEVELSKNIFEEYKYLKNIGNEIKSLEKDNSLLNCINSEENNKKLSENTEKLKSLRNDRNIIINDLKNKYNIEGILDKFGNKALDDSKKIREDFIKSNTKNTKTNEKIISSNKEIEKENVIKQEKIKKKELER